MAIDKNYSVPKCGAKLLKSLLFGWILCLVVFIALSFLTKYIFGTILLQFCCLLVMYSMIESVLWERGDRDCNLVQFGHIEKDYTRGLKIGLIGAVPFVITGLILIVCRLIDVNFLIVYRILNIPFIGLINLTVGNTGFLYDVPVWKTILVTLYPLLLIVPASWGCYVMGFKRIMPIHNLVYVKKDDKKKNGRNS